MPSLHSSGLTGSLWTTAKAIADSSSTALVGSPLEKSAFRAHYPELDELLQDWEDALIARQETREALKARYSSEAEERMIVAPEFAVEKIIDTLTSVTANRAVTGSLQHDVRFGWSGSPETVISVFGSLHEVWIDLPRRADEDDESWRSRARQLTDRVENLVRTVEGSEETAALRSAESCLRVVQEKLAEPLELAQKREQIFTVKTCRICQANVQ